MLLPDACAGDHFQPMNRGTYYADVHAFPQLLFLAAPNASRTSGNPLAHPAQPRDAWDSCIPAPLSDACADDHFQPMNRGTYYADVRAFPQLLFLAAPDAFRTSGNPLAHPAQPQDAWDRCIPLLLSDDPTFLLPRQVNHVSFVHDLHEYETM